MILPENLMNLIRQGEGLTVEFKKSTTDITKDVYDTVCSFSNRDGGHIFFGVKDNGTILGVDKDCVEQMKKNFVTTINNERKLFFTSMSRLEKPFIVMQAEYLTAIMSLTSISQIMRIWFSTFMPVSKVPIL